MTSDPPWTWSEIRTQYRTSQGDDNHISNRTVNNRAVKTLLAEIDVVTTKEAGQIYRYDPDTGVYKPDGETFIREHLKEWLGDAFSRRRVREITYHVESATYVPDKELESGPEQLICVQNGIVIDPRNPNLIEHDPKWQFLSGLPVEYDPEAECPRWEEFIHETVRIDDIDKLQEFAGYILHHWEQPYKRALLITGPKDSGKSTFLNTLGALLGNENVAVEPLQNLTNTRWGPAQLYGALANIYPDLGDHAVQNPAKFKALTGGDRAISAEYKGQNKFKFQPTAKQLFSANHLPSPPDDDVFHDRFIHVRFPKTIPADQQDPTLGNTLEKELSGILNWMLEGYQRLWDNEGFTNEQSTSEKRALWGTRGDSVARYREECLDLTGDPDDNIEKSTLYEHYVNWCEQNGENPVSYEDGTFTRRLTNIGPINQTRASRPDGRHRVYSGCRLT